MHDQARRIYLPGFAGLDDTRELAAAITSVGRPSVEIPPAGPASWLPIPVTLQEPAPGTVTQMVKRQLMRQASGERAADYKFTLRVEMPHDDGDARETWVAEGCLVSLCDQHYQQDGSVLISMEILADLVFTDIG